MVVAVKADCDGCRSFYNGSLAALAPWPTLLIARYESEVEAFSDSRHRVFLAKELWNALDIRSAPFYVLVAPGPGRIVLEGLAFSPEQVAAELIDAGM